jgi:hypothetical protein
MGNAVEEGPDVDIRLYATNLGARFLIRVGE